MEDTENIEIIIIEIVEIEEHAQTHGHTRSIMLSG